MSSSSGCWHVAFCSGRLSQRLPMEALTASELARLQGALALRVKAEDSTGVAAARAAEQRAASPSWNFMMLGSVWNGR